MILFHVSIRSYAGNFLSKLSHHRSSDSDTDSGNRPPSARQHVVNSRSMSSQSQQGPTTPIDVTHLVQARRVSGEWTPPSQLYQSLHNRRGSQEDLEDMRARQNQTYRRLMDQSNSNVMQNLQQSQDQPSSSQAIAPVQDRSQKSFDIQDRLLRDMQSAFQPKRTPSIPENMFSTGNNYPFQTQPQNLSTTGGPDFQYPSLQHMPDATFSHDANAQWMNTQSQQHGRQDTMPWTSQMSTQQPSMTIDPGQVFMNHNMQ